MTLVKTNEPCFIAGVRHRAGETFYLPQGLKPSAYMEVLQENAKPKKPTRKPKPKRDAELNTFSELTKRDADLYGGGEGQP
jgi:hypothetical protein